VRKTRSKLTALTIIVCWTVGRHICFADQAAAFSHRAAAYDPNPVVGEARAALPPPPDDNAIAAEDASANRLRHSYMMLHNVAQRNTQVTGFRTSRNIVELGKLIMFCRQSHADIRPGSRSCSRRRSIELVLLLLFSFSLIVAVIVFFFFCCLIVIIDTVLSMISFPNTSLKDFPPFNDDDLLLGNKFIPHPTRPIAEASLSSTL
jgi:hypothetical protein